MNRYLLNFKSFFQFLSRNKAYTFIDVFGLSVSLMFVILIAVYTWQELSTDRFQEKGDRICVLSNGNNCGSAYRLAQHVKDRYPEVEKICPVAFFHSMPVKIQGKSWNPTFGMVDSTFFDMFSFPLMSGTPHEVLSSRNYAVISESFARDVFGNQNPLGASFQIYDSLTVTVNGIMKDIKNSVIPYRDVFIRIDNIKYHNPSMDSEAFNNAGGAFLFFQLTKPGALDSKCTAIAEWFKTFFWQYQDGFHDVVRFVPLKDLYFSELNDGGLERGDWKFVMILMSVGILILLFAVINYINLTVAQTGFRAKEMATRRLLGSSRPELFLRLILESTFLSLISFLIGVFLAFAALPTARDLLQKKVDLAGAITPFSVLFCLGMILLLGVITGLLPAIIISNSKPIEVVRGNFRTKTKMVFSKFFITFQNVITITLIAISITMIAQSYHLIHAPLGYRTQNIITINVDPLDSMQVVTFADELKNLPVVKNVAISAGTPFNFGNNWSGTYDGHTISFQIIDGEPPLGEMLGFQILRDNHVGGTWAYYLSEEAFRQMGLSEDAPSFEFSGHTFLVAGKVKDFQLGNITSGKRAIMLGLHPLKEMRFFWDVLVEIQGDPFEARDAVEKVYREISTSDFRGKFLDERIEESFEAQKRTATIVSIFAGIAILISLLGLLAMSTYFIQQRYSEIAVRKVFGSTNRQILKRLVFAFLLYVGIAFVIAVPFIWYFMQRWLSDYSYRISLSPLIFIAAGLFCLLVSFAAVFIQSYRAANLNPTQNFRNKQ